MPVTYPAKFAVLLPLAALSAYGSAQNASFTGLGDLPGGAFGSRAQTVSYDGGVVAGTGSVSTGYQGFYRFGDQAMAPVPFPSQMTATVVNGCSADGGTLVGVASNAALQEAISYTPGDAAPLVLPTPPGYTNTVANGSSGDGSIIVGTASGSSGAQAFVADNGIVQLIGVPPPCVNSFATAISADGSMTVGYGTNSQGVPTPFAYTLLRQIYALSLPQGATGGEATAVSHDGSRIAGFCMFGTRSQAVYWDSYGVHSLGSLNGTFGSYATGISGDGSRIVGFAPIAGNQTEAFEWIEPAGMVKLQNMLASNGVTNLAGWSLVRANAISDTGNIVVGAGIDPAGHPRRGHARPRTKLP